MVKQDTPPEVVAFFQQQAAKRRRSTRPCAVCGTTMENVLLKQRYCSAACSQKAYRDRQRPPRAEGRPDV
jgi:predicted nucleic acid-binding Zn ribbon protein